jgi:outer membrane protein assembly factor BamE
MRYFLILLLALLTACGSALPSVKPFKMDIQQGNVVTSKMLLQLRPGMTKSQVRFIMGSPLIVDSFHKDRWDYFYQLRQAGKIVEQRRVILDFDKDLLTKVRGDVVPEGTAGAATGNESSVAKTITVEPKPKQEEGVLDKLKFWKDDEKAAVKPISAPVAKVEAAKPAEEKSWTEKLKFWKKDEAAKDAAKPEAVAREKTDALEANTSAPSGDAPQIDAPTLDTPSVLAVPIGGVLAPDAPAVEAPTAEAPVITAPVVEEPAVIAPMVEEPVVVAPVVETPPAETLKAEVLKPVEMPKAPVVKEPVAKPQMPKPQEAKAVPMPAAKAGERLIFRMDRNLDLKNLEAPVEAAPAPTIENLKSDNNAAPTSAKPKKIEPPLPTEEAPGYFERMLEKIGF